MAAPTATIRGRGLVWNLRSASPRDLDALLRQCSEACSVAVTRGNGDTSKWEEGVRLMQGAIAMNLVPTTQSFRRVVDLVARYSTAKVGLSVVTAFSASAQSRHMLLACLLRSMASAQPMECMTLLEETSPSSSTVPLRMEQQFYTDLAKGIHRQPCDQWAKILELLPYLDRDRVPPSPDIAGVVMSATAATGRWELATRILQALHPGASLPMPSSSSSPPNAVPMTASLLRNYLKSFTCASPWETALRYATRDAPPMLIQDAGVLMATAILLQRTGQWKQAVALSERIVAQHQYLGSDMHAVWDAQLPRLPWTTGLAYLAAAKSTSCEAHGHVISTLPPHQAALITTLMHHSRFAATEGLRKLLLLGGRCGSDWQAAIDAALRHMGSPGSDEEVRRGGDAEALTSQLVRFVLLQRPQLLHTTNHGRETREWLRRYLARNPGEAIAIANDISERGSDYVFSDGVPSWAAALEVICPKQIVAESLRRHGQWEACLACGVRGETVEGVLYERSLWEEAIHYAVSEPKSEDCEKTLRSFSIPLCARIPGRDNVVVDLMRAVGGPTSDMDHMLLSKALVGCAEQRIEESLRLRDVEAALAVFHQHRQGRGLYTFSLSPHMVEMLAASAFDKDYLDDYMDIARYVLSRGYSLSPTLKECLALYNATNHAHGDTRCGVSDGSDGGVVWSQEAASKLWMELLAVLMDGSTDVAVQESALTRCMKLVLTSKQSDSGCLLHRTLRRNKPLLRRLGPLLSSCRTAEGEAFVRWLSDGMETQLEATTVCYVVAVKLGTDSEGGERDRWMQLALQLAQRSVSRCQNWSVTPQLMDAVAKELPLTSTMWGAFVALTRGGLTETTAFLQRASEALRVQGEDTAADRCHARAMVLSSVAVDNNRPEAAAAASPSVASLNEATEPLTLLTSGKWKEAAEMLLSTHHHLHGATKGNERRTATRLSLSVIRRVWYSCCDHADNTDTVLELLAKFDDVLGFKPEPSDFQYALRSTSTNTYHNKDTHQQLLGALRILSVMRRRYSIQPSPQDYYEALLMCRRANISTLMEAQRLLKGLQTHQSELLLQQTVAKLVNDLRDFGNDTTPSAGEGDDSDTTAPSVDPAWTPQRLEQLATQFPLLQSAAESDRHRAAGKLMHTAAGVSLRLFKGQVPATSIVALWESRAKRERLQRMHSLAASSDGSGHGASTLPLGVDPSQVPTSVKVFAAKWAVVIRFGSTSTVNREAVRALGRQVAEQWPVHRLRTVLNVFRKEIATLSCHVGEDGGEGLTPAFAVDEMHPSLMVRLLPFLFIYEGLDGEGNNALIECADKSDLFSVIATSVFHKAVTAAWVEHHWPQLYRRSQEYRLVRWSPQAEEELVRFVDLHEGTLPTMLTTVPSVSADSIKGYWEEYSVVLAPSSAFHTLEMRHVVSTYFERLEAADDTDEDDGESAVVAANGETVDDIAEEISMMCFARDATRRPHPSFLYHRARDVASLWRKSKATLRDMYRTSLAYTAHCSMDQPGAAALFFVKHTPPPSVSRSAPSAHHHAAAWQVAVGLLRLAVHQQPLSSSPNAVVGVSGRHLPHLLAFGRAAATCVGEDKNKTKPSTVRGLAEDAVGSIDDELWGLVEAQMIAAQPSEKRDTTKPS